MLSFGVRWRGDTSVFLGGQRKARKHGEREKALLCEGVKIHRDEDGASLPPSLSLSPCLDVRVNDHQSAEKRRREWMPRRERGRQRQTEGEGGREGRFAQSSVINLPRPLAAKKNRRRARTRARTGAGSLLAHARGGLSTFSLSPARHTHNIDDFLDAVMALALSGIPSTFTKSTSWFISLGRGRQRALPSMLYSRFSSLSKRPKLEPDFLGRSFQIYSDETHYIVIRIQQGACRFGRTWSTVGILLLWKSMVR